MPGVTLLNWITAPHPVAGDRKRDDPVLGCRDHRAETNEAVFSPRSVQKCPQIAGFGRDWLAIGRN
jgi:hypothetical protein